MNYIVLDLEWNHGSTGKFKSEKKLPCEIIEIGAVKLNEKLNIVSSFNRYIKPQVYTTLHYAIKDIIRIDTNKFGNAEKFDIVFNKFIEWCGEEYIFCTWGATDLFELQRNMEYYNLDNPFPFPLIYYDIQKFYSILYGDGKTRKTLESVVRELEISTKGDFHNALNDAHYTSLVCKKIDFFKAKKRFSIDYYKIPGSRIEEIYATYDTYEKYISMGYNFREEICKDEVVFTKSCYICNKKLTKVIDWFSNSNHVSYFLGRCHEHGLIKGTIHIKKTSQDKVFAVRILKATDEAGAKKIREKYEDLTSKHKEKNAGKE